MDIVSGPKVERHKAFGKGVKVEMWVNKTGQQGFPVAIDHYRLLVFEFLEFRIFRHSANFAFLDSNQLSFWSCRVHGKHIGIEQNKLCHRSSLLVLVNPNITDCLEILQYLDYHHQGLPVWTSWLEGRQPLISLIVFKMGAKFFLNHE